MRLTWNQVPTADHYEVEWHKRGTDLFRTITSVYPEIDIGDLAGPGVYDFCVVSVRGELKSSCADLTLDWIQPAIARGPDGKPVVTFGMTPGSTYRVEQSTDFEDSIWETVATMSGSGIATFSPDTAASMAVFRVIGMEG